MYEIRDVIRSMPRVAYFCEIPGCRRSAPPSESHPIICFHHISKRETDKKRFKEDLDKFFAHSAGDEVETENVSSDDCDCVSIRKRNRKVGGEKCEYICKTGSRCLNSYKEISHGKKLCNRHLHMMSLKLPVIRVPIRKKI